MVFNSQNRYHDIYDYFEYGWVPDQMKEPEPTFCSGDEDFGGFPIQPSSTISIMGPPGHCKSLFGAQLCMKAVDLNPDLALLIANPDMGLKAVMNREISKMCDIEYTRLKHKLYTDDEKKEIINRSREHIIKNYKDRITLLNTPSSIKNIIEAYAQRIVEKKYKKSIILIDFIQLFVQDEDKRDGTVREEIQNDA